MSARRRGVALTITMLALTMAGCGSSDGGAGADSGGADVATPDVASASPSTIAGDESEAVSTDPTVVGPTEVAQRRIIPLDGDIAEIVYALGFGDAVVATDLSATYPQAAAELPKIGFERALNAEPILEFEPTIVIGTDAAGPDDAIEAIERVEVPVTIIERTFAPTGPASKIRGVADALGASAVGAALAADVQREIDDATVDAAVYARPMRVVALYIRGDDLQFVLGAGSGIHWIIEAAGAIDIADDLGVVETSPITAEALLVAAPDAIIVPEGGLESAGGLEALLAVPGIAETPAGRNRAILAYDDQLMLGNGPRTGAFLAQLVTDFRAVDSARSSSLDGS